MIRNVLSTCGHGLRNLGNNKIVEGARSRKKDRDSDSDSVSDSDSDRDSDSDSDIDRGSKRNRKSYDHSDGYSDSRRGGICQIISNSKCRKQH